MSNDFVMLHNSIKLLDLSTKTKKDLHSAIRNIHYKFLRLKQDIDGENTELANRAVKKIKIALKREIDEISFSYFLSKNERDFNQIKEDRNIMLNALRLISEIKNKTTGGDWDEIELAREIADEAIKNHKLFMKDST